MYKLYTHPDDRAFSTISLDRLAHSLSLYVEEYECTSNPFPVSSEPVLVRSANPRSQVDS
ncbi:MAG: hypothetical protein HC789_16795 [Microcoleus sp. CSU_2_2]|nr:hypothetical protein [Microcoleus sp. SU_5_3]NJS11910.1 hypothetical protein [Microcoleus sp. CSU_2_2]